MTGIEPDTPPSRRPSAGIQGTEGNRVEPHDLSVSIREVSSLKAREREAMWALYARFYAGTSVQMFSGDLDGKQAALLLHDAEGALQGFTTMSWWTREFEGRPVQVLFSGDTVIDRAHWGSQALAFNWLRFAGTLKATAPDIPLYWFLIVKGHRTYRYLSAFARRFIPHWSEPEPAGWRRLLDALAQGRFGDAYSNGVVRFADSHGHLAPELAEVSERERARPDVRLFLERNPGYVEGHELACLCELSQENLRPIARRVFDAGLHD